MGVGVFVWADNYEMDAAGATSAMGGDKCEMDAVA